MRDCYEDMDATWRSDVFIEAVPDPIEPFVRTCEQFRCETYMNGTAVGYVLRPTSGTAWRRGLATTKAAADEGRLQCVLFALPGTHDVELEDPFGWMQETRLHLPNDIAVHVVGEGGPLPCGSTPACHNCSRNVPRQFRELLTELATTHASLKDALRARLPSLSERDLNLFQAFATEDSPNTPGQPITEAELGRLYGGKKGGISDRQVRNILGKIRDNPKTRELYAFANHNRNSSAKFVRPLDKR